MFTLSTHAFRSASRALLWEVKFENLKNVYLFFFFLKMGLKGMPHPITTRLCHEGNSFLCTLGKMDLCEYEAAHHLPWHQTPYWNELEYWICTSLNTSGFCSYVQKFSKNAIFKKIFPLLFLWICHPYTVRKFSTITAFKILHITTTTH